MMTMTGPPDQRRQLAGDLNWLAHQPQGERILLAWRVKLEDMTRTLYQKADDHLAGRCAMLHDILDDVCRAQETVRSS